MQNPNKRNSKRVYPPKTCKQSGEEFIPTDKRQKFSNPQYRIDFNNDQRKLKNAALNAFTQILNTNTEILKKIYDSIVIHKLPKEVDMQLFVYEGYDFKTHTEIGTNKETKKLIHWCFGYGIEATGEDPKKPKFIIHKNE